MMGLGAPELGVIVLLVLLIFGPSQIPKLGKSIGGTIKEMRNIRKELDGGDE